MKLTDITDEELGKYNNNLKEFLWEELNIDVNDYNQALRISHRGRTIIMKRKLNERMVNNYNPHFLLSWQANIDIQYDQGTITGLAASRRIIFPTGHSRNAPH